MLFPTPLLFRHTLKESMIKVSEKIPEYFLTNYIL